MSVLPAPLHALGQRWLDRRLGKAAGSVYLHYRRIFILPSRGGLLFAAMLAAMWLGAVNYISSMAFLLCFLLAGIGCVSMVHSFRNLVGLELRADPAEPVFAGGQARFPLHVSSESNRNRYGLEFCYPQTEPLIMDISGAGETSRMLSVPAPRRGRLRIGQFKLRSRFPGGLFTAWSWLRFNTVSVVYPKPESGSVPPPPSGHGNDFGQATIAEGDEDFHGLRRYQAGDSLRQVAWRTLARGQELQTKQFASFGRKALWLDWNSLPELSPEARISRLTRWILDQEAEHRPYGLRLPGMEIPPACGPVQQDRCLTALALMPTREG
ncbi:MAG: DUF58 domain-containing protein [Aquisalimonadaceae bacterium]